jgi:hypothetical protein
MEKEQPDSLATVAVVSEKMPQTHSHYAPSEVYSSAEPPPVSGSSEIERERGRERARERERERKSNRSQLGNNEVRIRAGDRRMTSIDLFFLGRS